MNSPDKISTKSIGQVGSFRWGGLGDFTWNDPSITLIKFTLSAFSVFTLDNYFCFFEHANKLKYMQIYLFIHSIYNGSKSNLKAAIWNQIILY